MDAATIAKAKEITAQIEALRAKWGQVTPGKRPAIERRMAKLRAERTALIG